LFRALAIFSKAFSCHGQNGIGKEKKKKEKKKERMREKKRRIKSSNVNRLPGVAAYVRKFIEILHFFKSRFIARY